jgi:hypothetical protein
MSLRSRMKMARILNGCGPKLRWLNYLIPDQFFGLTLEEDCDHRDFNYTIGGKEADRLKADYQFYVAMDRRALARATSWRRPLLLLYRCVALAAFCAVRLMGGRFFHYGDKRDERAIMGLVLAHEVERAEGAG